jgi:DNA-nicking Smr family endonuclease
MSSGDGKRHRVLSPEERVIWAAVTKAITPLRESPAAIEDSGTKTASFTRHEPAAKTAGTAPAAAGKQPPQLTPFGRRMKQRVARGKETIDGRLDLHGLTQSEAHGSLLRFLRAANARDARLVLVITGKGARAHEGERGILKRKVPQWLALPEFRRLVIGYEDAHIAHGGEGALYIRIRRTRGG